MKKLGHYFNKGLKIGVLATALMTAGVGCSTGSDDDYQKTTQLPGGNEQNPQEKDPNEQDPNEKDPNEQDPNENEKDPNEKDPNEEEKDPNENTDPAEKYTAEQKAMGLHHDEDLEQGIFARHRFADPSDTFAGTQSQRLQLGAERFNEACEFMTQKVNQFGELLANDPAAQNFFGSSTDEVFNNTSLRMYVKNSGNVIDIYIAENNRNYAKYFAQMGVNILDDNEYNKFYTSYSKLAIRAYNDSLGALHDRTSFPTNKTDLPEVNQDLVDDQVITDGNTENYATVETVLTGILDNLANAHGMKPQTLYAGVELALFNEGMWGLSDLGGHGIITGDQVYKSPGYYVGTLSNRTRAIFMDEFTRIQRGLTPIQAQTTNEMGR